MSVHWAYLTSAKITNKMTVQLGSIVICYVHDTFGGKLDFSFFIKNMSFRKVWLKVLVCVSVSRPSNNLLLKLCIVSLNIQRPLGNIYTDFCLLQSVCCSVLTVTYCGFPFFFLTITVPHLTQNHEDGSDCWRPHVCLPIQMTCYIPGSPLMFLMSTNQNGSPHLTIYCYD